MYIICKEFFYLRDFNPSGAETGMFWENESKTITADALALCITRTSAAIIRAEKVCTPVFHKEGFNQISASSQSWKWLKIHIYLYVTDVNWAQVLICIFQVICVQPTVLYWLVWVSQLCFYLPASIFQKGNSTLHHSQRNWGSCSVPWRAHLPSPTRTVDIVWPFPR